MKRVEYDRYGPPSGMRLSPFTPLAPGRGEVLVRVRAASINPIDWKIRAGELKLLTGSTFPRGMGQDLSGEIIAVGSRVTDLKIGDEVLGYVRWQRAGAIAPLAVAPVKSLVRKPPFLSFQQAAALPTAATTAWSAIVQKAKLKTGQRVLINGAAGGVGHAAVQIAKAVGAHVVARVGERSFQKMNSLGVEDLLDYNVPITGAMDKAFDVVLDCHGGLSINQADRLLRPGGVIVDNAPTVEKALRSIYDPRRKLAFAQMDRASLRAVVDLSIEGKLVSEIATAVPLDEAIPLIKRQESGTGVSGKAIVVFD